NVGHLTITTFAANLPHGFKDMQHAAGRRWLAAVDHTAAGLDRQVAFESEIGFLEKCLVVSSAKTQIFYLNHDDGNVVIVEIQTTDVFVRDAGHGESALAGFGDAGNQRVGAIARPVARVVAL